MIYALNIAAASAALLLQQPMADETRLLRFPTISKEAVVFSYAGDLYSVARAGGIARKLTNHDGYEMFARFSPDGRLLAFTGQYDGNTEVYVMPAEGGVPRRLTVTATLERDDVADRMGPNNIVMGWKHDGKHILFRSRMRTFNDFTGQLYSVSVDGGLPQLLPLPRGGFASFSPDDSQLVYNRIFREFRTWKRYRGGMADDLWLYDFASKRTTNLTHTPAQEIIPMWAGRKIYFLSDRDPLKRMNLYSLDLDSNEVVQLTKFTDFDVKFPSLGPDAIVFEYGGDIHQFELATGKTTRTSIRIPSDHLGARPLLKRVGEHPTSAAPSPNGKRVLFGARGEIFSVPAKKGATHNLTNTSGVHERDPAWSPDGKTIAFISDVNGGDQIYTLPADGGASPTQITHNNDVYKYACHWSPDGKKLLWADRDQRLLYVDVASKEVKIAVKSAVFEINDAVWSPDSKWIAYSNPEEEVPSYVFLYSLDSGKSFPASEPNFQAHSPAFSPDGKYLYFVSARDFSPTYSNTEWNFAYLDMSRIYLTTLSKATPNPLAPETDEPDEPAKTPEKAADKKEKKEEDAPKPLTIDVEGLSERVVQLPVQPSAYNWLRTTPGAIYYVRHGSKDVGLQLFFYDLAARKETAVGVFTAYEITADSKSMLLAQGTAYSVVPLPKGPTTLADKIDLSGLEVFLDRQAEWTQIFHESWRQMRDFFYARNMHGVDWPAVRAKYAPLLPYVNHRADLTYVIGEMISELNVGHAYVGGGDVPKPTRIQTGLLGAQFERDPATKYFKISKILAGANWDKTLQSPLARLGVDVHAGDYLLAINGKPTNEMETPFDALINTVGKQIILKVNAKPELKGAREVVVEPIATEAPLYYQEWVQKNLRRVAEATKGKVGYIHVPDMLAPGLNQFAKQYYAQLDKRALIFDVRGNGGGNVSPMIIERLRRQPVMVDIARNGGPRHDPGGMIDGPMVCLINELSASDGDLVAYRFRAHKLGKLIGKRTWGGVVGIRGTLPLLDGGTLNRPEFSRYDLAGKEWIIEGKGVEPDIEVENDPAKEFSGVDEQLEKAIAVILEELKARPEKPFPAAPPLPVR